MSVVLPQTCAFESKGKLAIVNQERRMGCAALMPEYSFTPRLAARRVALCASRREFQEVARRPGKSEPLWRKGLSAIPTYSDAGRVDDRQTHLLITLMCSGARFAKPGLFALCTDQRGRLSFTLVADDLRRFVSGQ